MKQTHKSARPDSTYQYSKKRKKRSVRCLERKEQAQADDKNDKRNKAYQIVNHKCMRLVRNYRITINSLIQTGSAYLFRNYFFHRLKNIIFFRIRDFYGISVRINAVLRNNNLHLSCPAVIRNHNAVIHFFPFNQFLIDFSNISLCSCKNRITVLVSRIQFFINQIRCNKAVVLACNKINI